MKQILYVNLFLDFPTAFFADLQTDMLLYEMQVFLTELAQGPVANESIYEIFEFEYSLAQVCENIY